MSAATNVKGPSAQDVRYALVNVREVCARLGFTKFAMNGGRGVLVHCPSHAENSPSCSVRIGPDGTIQVKCFGGCDLSGTVLDLIAAVHSLTLPRDFSEVMRIAADMAGLERSPESGVRLITAPFRCPDPEPAREFPSKEEVEDLWSDAGFCSDDDEVSEMLLGRGLDPIAVDDRDLARVIAPDAWLPRWAWSKDGSWSRSGHRLILPMFDEEGRMRSVRAWKVSPGVGVKRLPPSGHKHCGLVLACGFGQQMLEFGNFLAVDDRPVRIVIVEGEPDFLCMACRYSDADQDAPVFLGVNSGSWSKPLAARVPVGSLVVVRTHHDSNGTGDKYAKEIIESLQGSCDVYRGSSYGLDVDENDAVIQGMQHDAFKGAE